MKIDKDNNNDSLIVSYEKRFAKKDRRKRPRMKVSGGARKLRELIIKK